MLRILTLLAACLVLSAAPLGGADLKRQVTLFFSGYVHGNYGPCGCKANPTGGLARRAGYIDQYRTADQGPILQVDLGGYFEPLGPASAAINRFLLEGLDQLSVDVLNLTSEDLFLWEEIAGNEIRETKIISSNLMPKRSSIAAPRRYAIETVNLGREEPSIKVRIGFLGLANPAGVKPNSGFRAEDPLEAVSRLKKEVLENADFLIVLADLPEQTAVRLAEENPEIYAVLRIEKRFRLDPPRQINNAVLLNSVERGRYLGQLLLFFDSSGKLVSYEPDYIELDDSVVENPLLREAQDKLDRELPARGSE